MLLCCDFTLFVSWIDREYKNIRKNKLFYTDKNIDRMSNTNEINDGPSSSESRKFFFRTLPIFYINGITNGLYPLKISRELEKQLNTLPLKIQITNDIIDGMKCHRKILEGFLKQS